MALTASTVGPYFATGSISFSQLRDNFKETSSGEVKASELLRVTDVTNTAPIVPDATENSSIATSSNLKTSQFRNSIKYYNLNQGSGDTDLNLNIAASSLWNGNLGKTIVKTVTLAGTTGSSTANTPAASLDASAVYNTLLIITGTIHGDGGAPGIENGASSTAAGDGGHALYIDTNSTGTVTVRTSGAGAEVFGGGGGGGAGGDGGTGGVGRESYDVYDYWSNTGCVGNTNCTGSSNFNSPHPCNHYEECQNWRPCGDGSDNLLNRICIQKRSENRYHSGGSGGDAADGGSGRGYLQSRNFGINGNNGAGGNGPGAGSGGNGGKSGNGGDWGEPGEDGISGNNGTNGNHTNGTAGRAGTIGGAAGRAVAGSGYVIDTANGVNSAYKGAK